MEGNGLVQQQFLQKIIIFSPYNVSFGAHRIFHSISNNPITKMIKPKSLKHILDSTWGTSSLFPYQTTANSKKNWIVITLLFTFGGSWTQTNFPKQAQMWRSSITRFFHMFLMQFEGVNRTLVLVKDMFKKYSYLEVYF